MKLKLLSAAVLLACASQTVLAEDQKAPEQGLYLGVFGDYFWADWDRIDGAPTGLEIGESLGAGFEAGYRFNKDWSARLEFTALELDIESTPNHKTGERYGVDLLKHFNDTIYGIVGVKKFDVYNDFNAANLGLGFRNHLTYNWAAFGEFNYYEGLNQNHSDFGLKLGLSYHFGEPAMEPAVEPAPTPAPVVAAAPTDSDKDGVFDSQDQCADTPMTDAVDEVGCTLYKATVDAVSLLVKFPNNKANVSSSYLADIQAVADFMNKHPQTNVVLEGHTSAVGKASYNLKLSEKRAEKVAQQLIADGIDATRITTVGKGEQELANPANTPAAHAENRRVVAHISTEEREKVLRNQ